SRDQLVPGRGRSAGRVLRPKSILPPLQTPRRRHTKAVPDARKIRLKPATLAKRPGGSFLPLLGRCNVDATDARQAVARRAYQLPGHEPSSQLHNSAAPPFSRIRQKKP